MPLPVPPPSAAPVLPGADPDLAAPEGLAPHGVRVHKAMAQSGLASRRRAEEMIRAGQVRLNGVPLLAPGASLLPGDVLEVRGARVEWERPPAPELWALYKPKGCVSTLNDPQGRRTVKEFFPRAAPRLFPIGRLDYDAEGLLLLTNDGALAQRVAHPTHGVPRVYLVKVKGLVKADGLARLKDGPILEGRQRAPVRARLLHTVHDKTWVEVTLREGMQHHIKKLFAALGHLVLKIKRYQIGPVELGDLRPGQCRKLGQQEMQGLLQAGAAAPKSGSPRSTGSGVRVAATRKGARRAER